MKSSNLIFRSLAVIIFIDGGAHLFSYLSPNTNANHNVGVNLLEPETEKEKEQEVSKIPKENEFRNAPQIDVLDLIGNWKATYNTDEYKGAIVYKLKKEKGVINAYTAEYQDENGYGEKAKNELVLIIKEFDGINGKGEYSITYEGEKYKIECDIVIINKATFKLSYDYYGYSDTEIWKKL